MTLSHWDWGTPPPPPLWVWSRPWFSPWCRRRRNGCNFPMDSRQTHHSRLKQKDVEFVFVLVNKAYMIKTVEQNFLALANIWRFFFGQIPVIPQSSHWTNKSIIKIVNIITSWFLCTLWTLWRLWTSWILKHIEQNCLVVANIELVVALFSQEWAAPIVEF